MIFISDQIIEMKKTISILLLFTLFANFLYLFILPSKVFAVTSTHDLTDSDNWNYKFIGPDDTSWLGFGGMIASDVNYDGENDLIIHATLANKTYIIYSTLLATFDKGSEIDLSDASKYNIRFDSGNNDTYGFSQIGSGDVNSNGKDDLIIVNDEVTVGGVAASGAYYVVYDSILDNYSGTGNIVTLSTSSNYSLRFYGGNTSATGRGTVPEVYDINGNGSNDLIINSLEAGSSNGQTHIIYDSILATFTGTGNDINLSTSSNWNIRIDGACYGLGSSVSAGDITASTYLDIFISSWCGNDNFYFSGSLLSGLSGTGNVLSTSDSNDYTAKITDGNYTDTVRVDDLDGDGDLEIMFTVSADSSFMYILPETVFSGLPGTGNTVSATSSSNYVLSIVPQTGIEFGYITTSILAENFFGLGRNSLVVMQKNSSFGSGKGSIHIIDYPIFSGLLSSSGNELDMNSTDDYSLRFDGPAATEIQNTGYVYKDLSGDGLVDIVFSDYTANFSAGFVYVVLNFPHTLTATASTSTITGTITATDSVTNIDGVEWSSDDDPLGTWTACTASDGSFNSTSEDYSCSITGTGTFYIRAQDTNDVYTPSSKYATATVGSSTPTPTSTSSSSTTDTTFRPGTPPIPFSSDPNATGMYISSSGGYTGSTNILTHIESQTFNFDAFLYAAIIQPLTLIEKQTIDGKKYSNVELVGGDQGIFKLISQGIISWQVGPLFEIWYKTHRQYEDKDPAIIIPSLQTKPSIISLSYTDGDLDIPGQPGKRYNPNTFKLVYSPDAITWSILPNSVVDTTNKTVSAIHKIGGYYMIVSTTDSASFSTSTTQSNTLGVEDYKKVETTVMKEPSPAIQVKEALTKPSPQPEKKSFFDTVKFFLFPNL